MRAVAISLVVLGHGWFFFPENTYTQFVKHFWIFGVEVFFVLSGFLIGGILIKSLEQKCSFQVILSFWVRRWFRTLPNYYLFLLINVIGFGIFSSSFQWNPQYLVFLQNFAWMPDGFFSVSWSLAVEEWFYLLLPPAIYLTHLATRNIRKSILITASTIILCVVTLRIYGAVSLGFKWNEELRMVVILRIDALMYGVLFSYLAYYHENLFNKIAKPLMLIGAALLAISFIIKLNWYQETHPLLAALMFPISAIGFGCFLPILSNWKNCHQKVVSRAITSISLWSYSLYLVHVPLLEITRLFVSKYINIYETPYNLFVYVSWITISIIASYFIYRFWERPTLKLREYFNRDKEPATLHK